MKQGMFLLLENIHIPEASWCTWYQHGLSVTIHALLPTLREIPAEVS